MAQATPKRLAVTAVAVLLAGGFGWWAVETWGRGDDEPAAQPTAGAGNGGALRDGPGLDAPAAAGGAQRDPDRDAKDALEPGTDTDPPVQDDAGAGTVRTEESPRAKVPPVRHSPFGLPKRKGAPRVAPGGRSSGWGGPTGHWMRFPSPPPAEGRAALQVGVVDESGLPIPGADVFIGPADVAGRDAVSFGDLRKLGKTDGQGTHRHGKLTEGTVAVAANFNNRMTRRFGLDTGTATAVTLRNGQTATTTVKLPLSVKDLGSVRGRVSDASDRPLANVQVVVGFNVVRTDREGQYAISGAPAGKTNLSFSKWSYESRTDEIEIAAGTERVHDVSLELAETGSVRIEGVVVGPEGEPVPEAHVYLNVPADRATLRSVRADGEGRFALEGLPDRLTGQAVEVQGGKIPFYGARRVPFPDGIASGTTVRIELTVRYARVELEPRDSATNEPIPTSQAQLHRVDVAEGETPPRPKGLWYDRRAGVLSGIVEPGRYRAVVEGLDHDAVELDLVVPAQDVFRQAVKLVRNAPDSVEIHLTLVVVESTTEAPVERVKIEVLDADGRRVLSRFEGQRAGGVFLMPAPSGARRLRVSADGHEPYDELLDLAPEVLEVEHTVHLRPK